MDYGQTITALKLQKSALDETIAALERLTSGGMVAAVEPKIERRGRKRMEPAERELVSARMKTYWAARRGKKASHVGSS